MSFVAPETASGTCRRPPEDEAEEGRNVRARTETEVPEAAAEAPEAAVDALEAAGAAGTASGSGLGTLALSTPRTSVRSYREIDCATFCQLRSSGNRNVKGGMIWNVCADRAPFNFHHVGATAQESDKWSEVIWETRFENDDGKPNDRLSIAFRASAEQVGFIEAFETCLVDQMTEKSLEVLQKATRRDIVQSFYKSIVQRKDGCEPVVKVGITVRAPKEVFLTTVFYYAALPEGGWVSTPQVVRGWAQLEPLLSAHRCKGTKIRGSLRLGSLQVVGGKNIYLRCEFADVHMRAPPYVAPAAGTLSEAQLSAICGLD